MEEEKIIAAYQHPFAELIRDYLTFQYEFEQDQRSGPKEFNRASAVGRDFYTNYHYRLGTPITNPPTAEGLGKMMAGDVFHWFVQNLFEQMGILKKRELKIELPELNVKGHVDAPIGVELDYKAEIVEVEAQLLEENPKKPKWLLKVKKAWLKRMDEVRPDIAGKTVEIKTLGNRMFDFKERTGWEPVTEHAMQDTEYHMGIEESTGAILVYICRDDFRLAVIDVDVEAIKPKVIDYWNELNGFVGRQEEPPLPEKIVFDETGRASLNWHVQYSPYLTKMFPNYKTKQDFVDENKGEVDGLNRAWARNELRKEIDVKYPEVKDQEARMLELYNAKKWTSTEYSVLKEMLGKTIKAGKLVSIEPTKSKKSIKI